MSSPASQHRSAASQRYYAHTAEDALGKRLPESSGQWQPLADHLRNVAELAATFAAPFGASDEARIKSFNFWSRY